MQNVIRIAKHLIPIEQIALFEPFVPPTNPLRSEREFKARVVLLDRNSVLSEETPEQLAADHGFRFLVGDRSATNPTISFRVETFVPVENFTPTKPYTSRLAWTDNEGNIQSKLMLTPPEELLAAVVRGEEASQDFSQEAEPARVRRPKAKRRTKTPSKNL
ncbi:hypothetical protein ACVIHI_007975 [Bradyrhizobium sp. USDA 4524]|uniref:hypothetical protein n=1 Tax=unclassified Bradyrhizobium TaxID=2631580 RepID=UPI00209E2B91|nr:MULTISPECIES: hypothetical protein [unclassified Bradyrhizobium]MCP1839111.1 hypothetical protein [Bradyrhizobium sp. USDA 4538]MCP1899676.1 hypothetical protein [Bradyrhizobium sp. USDA 4537]MCP1986214.1 hypothetical protein [Bradyrhizobium sp. USDA 4539]